MQVGIDLSQGPAKIAYRWDGIWHYHIMPQFTVRSGRDHITEDAALVTLLTHMYQDHLNGPIKSAVISYPHYWDMEHRRRLFQAVGSVFNGLAYYLLPGPVAALWGSDHSLSMSGDILIMSIDENTSAFSLLTVSQSGSNICLECQLPVEYNEPLGPALQSFIENSLQDQAEQLGFYVSGSWKLDGVIVIGPAPWLDQAVTTAQTCFAPIEVVIPEKAEFQLARGLAAWGEMEDTRPRLRMVYPYKFIQESSKTNQTGSQFRELLFDTANLPLEVESRYLVTALTSQSECNLSRENHQVHYRLFEKSFLNGDSQDDPYEKLQLIWEYHGSSSITPDPLGVYFNTREFIIESDSVGQRGKDQPALPDLINDYKEAGQRLMSIPFLDPRLKTDLQALADKPVKEYDLADQLESTRLRLLTLLQLTDT